LKFSPIVSVSSLCHTFDVSSKPPKDVNILAKYIVDAATGKTDKIEPPVKNPHAQALSKLGASKGGNARSAKLTDERKKEIAAKAAETRWAKYYDEKEKS
jgi:hypothetical protein